MGIGIGNVSNRNNEQQVKIRNYAVGILTLSAFHTKVSTTRSYQSQKSLPHGVISLTSLYPVVSLRITKNQTK